MANLYNSETYPFRWDSGNARVFFVQNDGYLNNTNVNNNGVGLRPISFLNLKLGQGLIIKELGYKTSHKH